MANAFPTTEEPHRGHHHGLEYIGRGYNILDGHVKDRINHYKLNQIKFAEETSDECVAHEQFNHFQSIGEYERTMTSRIRINQYYPGMFSIVSQPAIPPKSTTQSVPLSANQTPTSKHSSFHDTFHVASIFSASPSTQNDNSRLRSQSISHQSTPSKPVQLQRTQSIEGHSHHHHQPKVLLPFLCGIEKLDEYHHFIYEITKRAYNVSVIENNIYSPHTVNVADIYASGQSQQDKSDAELKGFLDFDSRFAIVKQAFSPDTKMQYYELFDRYGTHIIKQITIGSKAELRWSVKQSSHSENLTKNYELVNKITRTQKHKNMFMNATYYWKQVLMGNSQAQSKIPKHCIESHTQTRTFTLKRSDMEVVGAVIDNANPEKLRPSIDEIGDDVIAFTVEEFSSLFKTPFFQNQIELAVKSYIEEMSPIRSISALSDGMVVTLYCPDNGGSYITVDQHGHLVASAVSTQGTPGLTPRFDTPSHTPASGSEAQFQRSSSDLFSSGSFGSYPLLPSATRFFIPSEARFLVKIKGGKFGLQSVKYNSKYISKALWKANFNFHRLQFLGTHESFDILGDYLTTSGSIHGPTFLYINDDPHVTPSPCGMQIYYDGTEFKKTRLLLINPTIRSVALEDNDEGIEPIYIEDQFHNTDVTNKKKLSTLSPGRVKPEMGVFGTATALIDLSDEAKKVVNPPPFRNLPKSNSTSSLFIDDTILMPNIEEMTRCISITLHNWIESGMKAPQKHNIDLFSERLFPLTFSANNFSLAPSVETIAHFLSTIEKLVKLSPEPAIMFLIYMSRIINKTGLTLDPTNWRRITLSCIILASKVWEDCAVWNSDFLEAFPRITVSDLNRLEKLLLGFLEFNVSIKASEYVKFYFEIRQFFDVHMEKHKLTEALDQKSLEKLQIRTAYSQDEFMKAAKKEMEHEDTHKPSQNNHHHPHGKESHHEHHHAHSHDDTEAPDSKHPAHHHGPRGILS
mmetsp:Transcript_4606/g.6419  ORF Transcript_4606/g.6419 Transcript_4606/m.6419 type:complete len:969 (+) Transcript_4606:69-2975(+)